VLFLLAYSSLLVTGWVQTSCDNIILGRIIPGAERTWTVTIPSNVSSVTVSIYGIDGEYDRLYKYCADGRMKVNGELIWEDIGSLIHGKTSVHDHLLGEDVDFDGEALTGSVDITSLIDEGENTITFYHTNADGLGVEVQYYEIIAQGEGPWTGRSMTGASCSANYAESRKAFAPSPTPTPTPRPTTQVIRQLSTPTPTPTPTPGPTTQVIGQISTPSSTPANETGKPLSLKGTPLETFVENWEILVGLGGALSIIGYYLHILKRKTLGEEDVKVKRGVTREGNIIKIGVKVLNDSTFPLVDVSVQLDVPKAFRIEGGSKFIDLGILKQGEFQSAIFKLVPTRCVSGNITGTVTYHDVKNNRKVLEVQEVTVGSVCPFLEKVPVTYEAFEEKVKPLPSNSKRMRYSLDPRAIYQKLQGKCSSMHVVHEGYSDEGTKYVGLYSARGAYSKSFIGMRIGLDISSNELVVKVYGEQEEMVTGLLGEIVELLEEGEG